MAQMDPVTAQERKEVVDFLKFVSPGVVAATLVGSIRYASMPELPRQNEIDSYHSKTAGYAMAGFVVAVAAVYALRCIFGKSNKSS